MIELEDSHLVVVRSRMEDLEDPGEDHIHLEEDVEVHHRIAAPDSTTSGVTSDDGCGISLP